MLTGCDSMRHLLLLRPSRSLLIACLGRPFHGALETRLNRTEAYCTPVQERKAER
jgi:hypothetical protein